MTRFGCSVHRARLALRQDDPIRGAARLGSCPTCKCPVWGSIPFETANVSCGSAAAAHPGSHSPPGQAARPGSHRDSRSARAAITPGQHPGSHAALDCGQHPGSRSARTGHAAGGTSGKTPVRQVMADHLGGAAWKARRFSSPAPVSSRGRAFTIGAWRAGRQPRPLPSQMGATRRALGRGGRRADLHPGHLHRGPSRATAVTSWLT